MRAIIVLTISLAAELLLATVVPLASSWSPKRLREPSILQADCRNFRILRYRRGNRFVPCGLVNMQTFETIDPKVARRCRYDQHRRQKTSLTVGGSLVTGLVHSVMEAKASNPKRWIITIVAKPSIAA